jgi:hypothetical protein
MFHIILTINADYLLKQHNPVDFCNGEVFVFWLRTELLNITRTYINFCTWKC